MVRLLKTIFLVIVLATLFSFGNVAPATSEENYIVTIGQNKVFTACNYHNAWFTDDPPNPGDLPSTREAFSVDNSARVSLTTPPGFAGRAHAQVGVEFQWDTADYSWEEVRNRPVKVIIDFSYSIGAYGTEWYSSGNAGLIIPPLLQGDPPMPGDSSVDWVGHLTGDVNNSRSVSRTMTFTEKWDKTPLTVETLGGRIDLFVMCQAGATTLENNTTIANVWSQVAVNSIKIEFICDKQIIEDILDKNYWCPPLWPFSKHGNVDGKGLDDWFYRRLTDGATDIELWGIDNGFFNSYFALMLNGPNMIGKCVYNGGRNKAYIYRNACTNKITHVLWESHDVSNLNTDINIWRDKKYGDWKSVAGKDYLRFTYDVAKNKLVVTHFSENGAVLKTNSYTTPAVPSNSFTIDGEVVPELDYPDGMIAIPAIELVFEPPVLLLNDSRPLFQVYLKFRLGNGVADINPATILLNSVLAPEPGTGLVDRDQDGELELLLKFDLAQVKNLLGEMPGNRTITITGDLLDGTGFRNQSTILVRSSAFVPFFNLLLVD